MDDFEENKLDFYEKLKNPQKKHKPNSDYLENMAEFRRKFAGEPFLCPENVDHPKNEKFANEN